MTAFVMSMEMCRTNVNLVFDRTIEMLRQEAKGG